MRKPGKKIGLPPRVPAFIGKLLGLREETPQSKKKRAEIRASGRPEPEPELRYIEFATPAVLEIVENARACAQAESRKPRLASSLPDTVFATSSCPYLYSYSYRYLGYPYIYSRGEPTTAILASPVWLLASAVGLNLEREILNDAALRLDLDTEIREVVRDYFVARRVASKPKEFRRRIKGIEAALVKLLAIFPAAEDDLTEALNCGLYGSDDDDSPYVQQIRRDIEKLLKVVAHLREQKGGAGMDADRPKHQLATGLAAIFEKHAGLQAGFRFSIARDRSGDDAVCGPFADFFKAVNKKIKEISFRDRVIGLEALIRPFT